MCLTRPAPAHNWSGDGGDFRLSIPDPVLQPADSGCAVTRPRHSAFGIRHSAFGLRSRRHPAHVVSMPHERLARQMQFIIEADRLKEVFRRTVLSQSRRAENSAEHSWHFALMIITLAEHSDYQPLDVLRVLKMVLL